MTVKPEQAGSAFVPLVDKTVLDRILCLEFTRTVANDNTVVSGKRALQIQSSPYRFSFARAAVIVREHLEGYLSVWHGPRVLGWYDAQGRPLAKAPKATRTRVGAA